MQVQIIWGGGGAVVVDTHGDTETRSLDQLQVDICLAVHMRLHSMSLAPSDPPQYHGNHHSYASWTGIGLCEVCCGRCLLELIGSIVRLKHS
jgi:hypothetical protein